MRRAVTHACSPGCLPLSPYMAFVVVASALASISQACRRNVESVCTKPKRNGNPTERRLPSTKTKRSYIYTYILVPGILITNKTKACVVYLVANYLGSSRANAYRCRVLHNVHNNVKRKRVTCTHSFTCSSRERFRVTGLLAARSASAVAVACPRSRECENCFPKIRHTQREEGNTRYTRAHRQGKWERAHMINLLKKSPMFRLMASMRLYAVCRERSIVSSRVFFLFVQRHTRGRHRKRQRVSPP